jgi:hypothetical protein
MLLLNDRWRPLSSFVKPTSHTTLLWSALLFIATLLDLVGQIPGLTARSISASTVIIGNNNTVVRDGSAFYGGIEVDVSMATSDDKEVKRLFPSHLAAPIPYTTVRKNGELVIRPENEYLKQYMSGAVQAMRSGLPVETIWDVSFPLLDIRMINNTRNTVVIKEIQFDVNESRADDSPFIVLMTIYEDCAALHVYNEGWASVRNCIFEFNLFAVKGGGRSEADRGQQYKYRIETGPFDTAYRLDLSDALENEGVNVKFLRKAKKGVSADLLAYKQALGSFTTGLTSDEKPRLVTIEKPDDIHDDVLGAGIAGRFTVVADASSSAPPKTVLFRAFVPLTPPGGLGDYLPGLDGFDVKLKPTGSNYKIEVPVAAYLRPGDPERFLIRLGATQSGWHRFNVKLLLLNNQLVDASAVDAYIFLPRSNTAVAQE